MRTRILAMRQGLVEALARHLPGQDVQFFLRQRGMFSYTGFSPEQARRLRDEFGVYILDSGRVCMAGLREDNLQRVAEAFAAVHRGGAAGLIRAPSGSGSTPFQRAAFPCYTCPSCQQGFAFAPIQCTIAPLFFGWGWRESRVSPCSACCSLASGVAPG